MYGQALPLARQYKLKKIYEIERQASLEGYARLIRRPMQGRRNAAVWILGENPDTQDGIPSVLRTAILLKREVVDEKSQATLEAYAEINWKSS